MSEIHLPILSQLRVCPLDWLNKWGKLRTRVIIKALGAALEDMFYCIPYSGSHKQPVH
jgi:hypothetical protein